MTFTEIIARIPTEVWAAIAGAALALGGVLLTNRNNRQQLVASLEHDSEQRNRERELALKRDIYVPAAEGVNRLVRLIYSMNDLDLSNDQLVLEQKEASTAIARLQVVASNELIQATNVFMHAFNLAYMEMILKRAPLIDNKIKMDLVEGVLKNVNQDQDRLIEYMRQANLSGSPDQNAMNMLNRSFEYGQTRRTELSAQHQKLWVEQGHARLTLSDACFSEGVKLSNLVPPMLFAARRELEMPIDEAVYLVQHDAYMQKAKDAFSSFLAEAAKLAGKKPE